ncbi:methylmalonyl-CoA mutase family protein [Lutibacter holmesii]|uniref:Methylmalonyl-CoA mutase family protein n=1 Tax=Lutibacter holmesii TaxID=1137985 RepID=A0ABW3WP77_9FLAO
MSNPITNDFEPSSAAAWKQKLQFELNGADYSNTLLTKTNEGITIKPFYHLDNFEKLIIPTTPYTFKICQKINIASEKAANEIAVNAIKNGVKALKFEATKPFVIDELFQNSLNKNIDFHFQLTFLNEDFIHKLIATLKDETVFLNIDIIGNLAETGNWHTSLTSDFKIIEDLLQQNNLKSFISVNSNIYQNAGANIVQQIAYTLAHANEYIHKFGANTASKIQFNFATGSHYFFEIAKIRAFRYLHKLILNEYNCTANAQIYCEPSLRNKTLLNFQLNKLRVTTENMSAIIGGSNTIANHTNNPLFFNKDNNNFQRLNEISKNISSLNVEDITTDSYFIESITKQLAEKALTIFKDIEKSGGFLSQLKSGTIQRKIKENALKEQEQFKTGELSLLDSNKFIQNKTNSTHTLNTNPFTPKKPYKTLIIPISPTRLAEKLELKKFKYEA